jgi:hypothetical protein
MRWCVSIGGVLVAGAIAAGDVAGIAAPDPRSQLADAKGNLPSVDVELVIAVDVSYSMDMDELAVQRELRAGHRLEGISAGAEDRPEQQGGRDLFRVVGIE